MPYSMDPQIAAALAPLMEMTAGVEPPPAGDWKARRDTAEGLFGFLSSTLPAAFPGMADVGTSEYTVTAPDGATIGLRWYTPAGWSADGSGPGIYYVHGGGMILGTVDLYDGIIRSSVVDAGVPMLAVDYRLAPENAGDGTGLVEDCYAGLVWFAEHAAELGVDPARIAIAGDSAGGGLAAGTTLMARDRGGPALARQILIYPMLDDRNTVPDPALVPFLTWTYDDNVTGWGALLGDAAGTDAVSAYAAPARATDLSGLPPTYVDVGELDIFRDEDIEYARRIAATGTSVELHVHPGVPHAFEGFAPTADVSRRTRADRTRWMTSF